jgi:23S rRNA (uracil1939-C5)-methyltransferase
MKFKIMTEINIKKNDIINLVIEDVSIDGDGVGRWNGMAVFVPKGAVGDSLLVRILKIKSNYLIGKIEKILSPSADRIALDCPVYNKCGGCAFRHVSYDAELKIKQKHVSDCLQRIGGFKNVNVENVVGAEKILNYRNKAQVPLGYDKSKNLISGFFRPRSHDIIDCHECKLHPAEFDQITDVIKVWMKEHGITAYDENLHSGTLRHIYLRSSKNCDEIMVCLIINTDELPYKAELIETLTNKFNNIASIVLNFNLKNTNVVMGEKFKNIWGADYITDNLCGLSFKISPVSFYQVNHDQTEILYNLAKDVLDLKGGERLLDLYCGIGTIGMVMSDKVSSVVGVEIVQKAVVNAEENAKLNGIDNIKFICGDSSEVLRKNAEEAKKFDVAIIDPPRKGCGDELIEDLLEISPRKILYISCNPATLAKDLKKLCEEKYKIEKVCPVDLFPRTKHVECVTVLAIL